MKSIFSLNKKPWMFTFLFMISWVVLIIFLNMIATLVLRLKSSNQIPFPWITLAAHILTIFIAAPFVLGFPGKSHSYGAYLSEIRLTQMQPLLGLILLGVSCYLILGLSQATGVLVYRLAQGLPVDGSFIRGAFRLADELPPRSLSWLYSMPSFFEEIAWRGVVLAVFLRCYDRRKAILFSALGFGLMHILTLLDGHPLVWTAGQVVWAAILGLFYGYVTLKTGSLLPAMLVHYLGNLLVAAINAYVQQYASNPAQVVYGILFTFGVIPAVLMMLWARRFSAWRPFSENQAISAISGNALSETETTC
jgi:membrane protease YdiL (CAAX protease family)